MSAEVLPKPPIGSFESEGDDIDDEFSTPSGPLSTIKTYDENSSIAKLPGTALLRSVHNKPKNVSNHESIKSLHSDHTYDFDKTNSAEGLDNVDEFGEDLAGSPVATNKKLPAWKLRQQALESDDPSKTVIDGREHRDKKISPLKAAKSRARAASNKNSPNQRHRKTNTNDQSWLKKLTTKKETPAEKEKRLKNEKLIKKQVSSRWGKDILEEDEDESESHSEEMKDKNDATEKEEDESDTVKKVKSLIEKSFGSALVSTIKKDKEAANEADKDEDSSPDSPTKAGRGNRWALMGSAAMTSMRNVQRGLMGGDENEKTEKDTITEGENEDDGDEVAVIQNDGDRRANMWKNRGAAAFTSVRNAWGGAEARRKELFNGDDELDSMSVHSDPGRLGKKSSRDESNKQDNKLLSSIGNFLQHTRARFDPEVWADPKIQETVADIEKLRNKLNKCRHDHRNATQRREQQIENSIRQQKTFLARKLARQIFGYRTHPFHPCIKEVYEKEILIIVHEVTNLRGDDESTEEQDGIDKLLDSQQFDFDYKSDEEEVEEANDTLGAFFSKNNKEKAQEKKRGDGASVDGSLFSVDGSTVQVGGNSVVPLQTRLIRAQHNEWMTNHQMELVRSFQQKSIEHLYDVIPEMKKEHDKLKAIPDSALDAKVKQLEESNKQLREAYQAHVEAQEKLLAIYRERYVPSVHGDEEKDETNNNGEDTINTPQSPQNGIPVRPGMWAKNVSQSVRGLFGPKKDENGEKNGGDDDSVEKSSQGGFNLPSPIPDGSNSKSKFLLSFGSPADSKAASGILANFASPLPFSKDDDEATDKQSQQDSAKDSAAAAWTVPKMDKGTIPETLAEKRAKRAAARRANRPDAPSAESSNQTATKTKSSSTSRSELLQRARKARQESAAALGAATKQPSSPTPTSRSGRSSLRSNTASTRKELSMKDLMAAAGDSRRKLQENDSRMEKLAQKKDHLSKTSSLSSPTPSLSSTRAGSRISERLRIVSEVNDGLSRSSHHSLHERNSRGRSLKSLSKLEDDNEDPIQESSLHDVDEFGGEAQ